MSRVTEVRIKTLPRSGGVLDLINILYEATNRNNLQTREAMDSHKPRRDGGVNVILNVVPNSLEVEQSEDVATVNV